MRKIGRKYELLSSRFGLSGSPFSSMEWMEENYNTQTIKKLTENVGIIQFIKEIIDVLSFDIVNIDYLSLELGYFNINERQYISNLCFNEKIHQIKLFLEDQTKWSDSEINSLEIELKELFNLKEVEELFLELGFLKLVSDTNILAYVKHDIDVWLYQEKKPSMEVTFKIENKKFRFVKIEYKGQPFL